MTELIKNNWAYRGREDVVTLDQDDEKEIKELLLGHRVARIAVDHMELDDGTVIKIVPNEGCGGCTSGWYGLDQITEVDNIITHVECEETDNVAINDGWDDTEYTYRVFVVAEDKRINLYSVSGDDGNGYYGTGYELLVRYPK